MANYLSRTEYLNRVAKSCPAVCEHLDHLFRTVDDRRGIWLRERNAKTLSIRLSLEKKTGAFTVAMFHLPAPNYRDSGKGDGDIWFGRELRKDSREPTEVEKRAMNRWCQALDDTGIGEAVIYERHWGRTLWYAEFVEHRKQIGGLLRELMGGLAGG